MLLAKRKEERKESGKVLLGRPLNKPMCALSMRLYTSRVVLQSVSRLQPSAIMTCALSHAGQQEEGC